MICPECEDGFVSEPTPKPLVITYRGFSRTLGTQLYLSCTNCLYEATEPLESNVDTDAEMSLFKIEINRKLSTGKIV